MKTAALYFITFLTSLSFGQSAPFELTLEPMNVPNLGGLQSFAFGQSNGKWLIIGGRLDGLHRRQPFASFDEAGHNNMLIVVDPANQTTWSHSLTSLSTNLQEQLQSTNMQFHQRGDFLYLTGGYGYSATAVDHITFPHMAVVDVPQVINEIVNAGNITTYIRQYDDTLFQVTGGRLEIMDSVFYLMGGNKFMGRYNPMNNPTFTQQYTNAVRRFTVEDDGTNLTYTFMSNYEDSVQLHRRDYNAVPQIMPNGDFGITMFSGVFQPTIDLPFLNSVDISSSGYNVNNAFTQYYNHYHCANTPIYSVLDNEMHTIFYGGIAQYYDSVGILVQDDNVPFVSTIARVTREQNGVISEYKLPVEMPALLGAGSEFIIEHTIPTFDNHVIDLDAIIGDTTLIGYIYGGISSSEKNIFWINDGTQSTANSQIFKVYMIKNGTTGLDVINAHSVSPMQLLIYPNPTSGEFKLSFNLPGASDVLFTVTDIQGKVIEERFIKNLQAGNHVWTEKNKKMEWGGVYFVRVETIFETQVRKLIVED